MHSQVMIGTKIMKKKLVRSLLSAIFINTISINIGVAQEVKENTIPAEEKEMVNVFTVQASDRHPTVSIGGSVVPYKSVTLSAQLPGRVIFLSGIEGDEFTEGETLVALEDTELLAKRASAYAQLSAADAQLRNAGVQYSRELWSPKVKSSPGGMGMPNMFDQMFTSPAEGFFGNGRDRDAERSADLYASSVRIEQSRSAMMRTQAEIQAIDAKLRDAKSKAPFKGTIMAKFVEVGDTVQPGMPLLQIADINWLQVELNVPARLVNGMQEMMILKKAATFDDFDEAVDIRVAQIFPMADAKRHTVKVKFDIPQGVSQPGMYVRVKVPDMSTAALQGRLPSIPTKSIRYRGSLPVVYVRNAQGEPELRLIREGKRLDDGTTIVLSGLAPGDQIFANPGPDFLSRSGSK